MKPDIKIEDSGTIYLLTALSNDGLKWLRSNLCADPWQWVNGDQSIAVDYRMSAPIIEGIISDGLKIEHD